MASPSGPPSGVDATQPPAGVVTSTRSKSGICPGVVRLVPEGLRVVQVEVMPEQFAEAVGRARGPPTLKWCQAAARVRLVPNEGSSVSLRNLHQGYGGTPEQGWDQGWVAVQLEEGWKGRVSGRGSGAGEGEQVSVPVMKVGPPRGGRREGAPSMQEKGKQRASPSPEAGPSKWARGKQVMEGPPGSMVYSPMSGAPVEQSADSSWSVAEAYLRRRVEGLERLLVACEEEIQGVREERDRARRELDRVRRERDLAQKDKNVAIGTAAEQLSHLQELEVWTVHLQARAEAAEVATQQKGGSGVRETQQGSSAGEVRAVAERAWQREEWLANKAASGWRGVLHEWFPRFCLLSADSGSTDWAREHRILLDGASAVLGSIHDGLARVPGDLPPELGQGVMQMGCLLAGHWQRAMADPGVWWEMATDVGKPLPG
ncbi:hypothetical protein E4T56_gene11038 [Termitomyces sp. T112]|nr:hypothetical protein E4T56_gene11038 [Termitomyces sp. T112]